MQKLSLYYLLFVTSTYVAETFPMTFSGGGNVEEGEFIEVVEMTVPEVKKYLDKGTVLSPGGFIFALLWFFQNKCSL